jgi:hypothetical protein
MLYVSGFYFNQMEQLEKISKKLGVKIFIEDIEKYSYIHTQSRGVIMTCFNFDTKENDTLKFVFITKNGIAFKDVVKVVKENNLDSTDFIKVMEEEIHLYFKTLFCLTFYSYIFRQQCFKESGLVNNRYD